MSAQAPARLGRWKDKGYRRAPGFGWVQCRYCPRHAMETPRGWRAELHTPGMCARCLCAVAELDIPR